MISAAFLLLASTTSAPPAKPTPTPTAVAAIAGGLAVPTAQKAPDLSTDTPTKPPDVPPELAPWTPRPATGKSEPWERMGDKDWIDTRLRAMDTGPFFDATMRYPWGKGQTMVFKAVGVKLGEKGDAGVIFDRNTLRLAAGWTGGFLHHSDKRFGLLNTPTPSEKSTLIFSTPDQPGWANPDGKGLDKVGRYTAPLPAEWAKYRGLYLHGDRVVLKYTVGKTEVLEFPGVETIAGVRCIVRTLRIEPTEKPEILEVGRLPKPSVGEVSDGDLHMFDTAVDQKGFAILAAKADPKDTKLRELEGGEVHLTFAPAKQARVVRLIYAVGENFNQAKFRDALKNLPPAVDPATLTKPGPARWGKPLETRLERGNEDGPFALDTLTIPYVNPYKALFFCTGLDFLPDGRIAMCTCHGDVWLVSVDEKAGTVAWKRYATGLYHPLGLKVVDGKVHVLERGQLTRLHDSNADDEADFYENVNNDWHLGGGEHSYDTSLETDPEGNFYFIKTGDTDTPTGGCLIKISKDGAKSEIFCTGFRHAIGLGISPTGVITGADQEGNWMPATRIDIYKKGGFYGDMRAHHRETPPTIYDPPVCWLPREVDNSAGGQVWVPPGKWGELAGHPLHFSYGRCKLFVLLMQEIDGVTQGGVCDLGLTFLSGVCRGRFHPTDGNLYACGLNGWQTAAKKDGCLQRVRYTGKPLDIPVALKVVSDGVELTFSRPLDKATAEDPERYRLAWWGYRWSKDYGSKRYKISDPDKVGQDDVTVSKAKLQPDGKTVRVVLDGGMKPAMQVQVGFNITATDGKKVVGSVFLTAHKTRGEK